MSAAAVATGSPLCWPVHVLGVAPRVSLRTHSAPDLTLEGRAPPGPILQMEKGRFTEVKSDGPGWPESTLVTLSPQSPMTGALSTPHASSLESPNTPIPFSTFIFSLNAF